MKQMILIIAVLCCATSCFNVLAVENASLPKLTILKQDTGKNLSDMNITLYSAVSDFGEAGLNIGEAVKFIAPNPGWKLHGVQVVGWSGFNETTKRLPADKNFLIEIRDSDLNLLYKFADMQNMYFASNDSYVASGIEIPSIPLAGDFYVVFYDRGSMGLGMEQGNGTGYSSLLVNNQLIPAEFKIKKTNETVKVNWLIRAVGG